MSVVQKRIIDLINLDIAASALARRPVYSWKPEAAPLTAAQKTLIDWILLSGVAGCASLRITSATRSGGWHAQGRALDLSLAIDYNKELTTGADSAVPLSVIWRTYWQLVRMKYPGGLGLDIGRGDNNAHLHIDIGRSQPYYFLEYNPKNGPAWDSYVFAPGMKRWLEIAAQFYTKGVLETWIENYLTAPAKAIGSKLGDILLETAFTFGGLYAIYKYIELSAQKKQLIAK